MTIIPILDIELKGDLSPVTGAAGELRQIDIANLRIDLRYQRSLTRGSSVNVRQIAKDFDWRRFTPVIAVLHDDGTFSVIDGQHRTIAAKARGIESVPVYVMAATVAEAAGAFAAINGNVTLMASEDVFRARVAAGEPEALSLQMVMDAADVRLVSGGGNYSNGGTRAVKVLLRAMKVYGPDVLTTVLQCITQTGDGRNAGLITGAFVNGIAKALLHKPEYFRETSKLFEVFDTIDLPKILELAQQRYLATSVSPQDTIKREVHRALVAARGGK